MLGRNPDKQEQDKQEQVIFSRKIKKHLTPCLLYFNNNPVSKALERLFGR